MNCEKKKLRAPRKDGNTALTKIGRGLYASHQVTLIAGDPKRSEGPPGKVLPRSPHPGHLASIRRRVGQGWDRRTFRVPGDCYEKLAVGPPAGVAKPTRETFHGFRVSQWDMSNWFEKFIAGMALHLSPTKMLRLFMVSGCPKGT